MSELLEVRGLTKMFGGVTAVKSLDFDVRDGEILGVIGPNGSGKSTVFSMISGFQRPTAGQILLDGRSVVGKPAFRVAQLGISRLFQHSVLFGNMSVLENVIVGFHRTRTVGLASSFFVTRRARKEENDFRTHALEVIDFVGLADSKDETAASLSHGHQRLLSVAVTLAANPHLLLLDEPVTGMIEAEMKAMVAIIRAIRERGITVVLVEHHMKVVNDVCDRVIALNYGEKIVEGTPGAVCQHPEVCAAYLGKGTYDAP